MKTKVRRPLNAILTKPPKPSAAKKTRFLAAGTRTQWKPGQSGNPSGRSKNYAEFIAACRESSPRALQRLREAIELPWSPKTSRTILTAAIVVIERAYGKAVNVVVDATPPKTGPTILLDQNYWSQFVEALKDSGALESRVTPDDDAEVIDAEAAAAPDKDSAQ